MREWLSGRASPCQGEGRGFESRFALLTDPVRTKVHAALVGRQPLAAENNAVSAVKTLVPIYRAIAKR